MIVGLVNIGGIDDHHSLNFLFINDYPYPIRFYYLHEKRNIMTNAIRTKQKMYNHRKHNGYLRYNTWSYFQYKKSRKMYYMTKTAL